MAIAITLLVLGLEVPSVHEVPDVELAEYLRGTFHPLLGFVLSFTLIGTYWMQHYAIFHYIEHVSRPLVIWNGLFLMCVTFLPFPTGLQAAYRHDELAMVLYGSTHCVCGLSLLALWIYATLEHRHVPPEISPQVIRSMTWRIILTPIVSVVAIGVSFISLNASKLLFLTIPIIYFSHQAVDKGWIRPENVDQTSQD
jgi:uncharacterized membrane protein